MVQCSVGLTREGQGWEGGYERDGDSGDEDPMSTPLPILVKDISFLIWGVEPCIFANSGRLSVHSEAVYLLRLGDWKSSWAHFFAGIP